MVKTEMVTELGTNYKRVLNPKLPILKNDYIETTGDIARTLEILSNDIEQTVIFHRGLQQVTKSEDAEASDALDRLKKYLKEFRSDLTTVASTSLLKYGLDNKPTEE